MAGTRVRHRRFSSRSRSQQKITGVTIRMWTRLLSIPPTTGAAIGFITSAPVRALHRIGSRPATGLEADKAFYDDLSGDL